MSVPVRGKWRLLVSEGFLSRVTRTLLEPAKSHLRVAVPLRWLLALALITSLSCVGQSRAATELRGVVKLNHVGGEAVKGATVFAESGEATESLSKAPGGQFTLVFPKRESAVN